MLASPSMALDLVEPVDLPRAIEVAKSRGFTWLAHPMKFRDGTELQRSASRTL